MGIDKIGVPELEMEGVKNQPKSFFDPEKEITAQDWVKINDDFYKRSGVATKHADGWAGYSDELMYRKILKPYSGPASDDTIILMMIENALKHSRELAEKNHNWTNFAVQAARTKVVAHTIDLGIDEQALQGMNAWLEDAKKSGSWESFSSHASKMKIIDPKINLGLDQTVLQGIKDSLNKRKLSAEQSGSYVSFLDEAVAAKIVVPDIDLGLDQNAWQGMKAELGKSREAGHWYDFTWVAAEMKILAAEKVEATDTGLEITMPEGK